RLGTSRVVRIALGGADDALPIDDESRGDRQGPRRLAVERLEVERERAIDLAQILGEGEAEAEPGRHLVAAIRQDRERKVTPLAQPTTGPGKRGRLLHEA